MMKDFDKCSWHGRLGGVVLAAWVALALFGGCSSSEAGGDPGLRCGAGTTESNGECVATSADAAPSDAAGMDGGESSDAPNDASGDGLPDASEASIDAIDDPDAAVPDDAPEEPLEPADPCPAGYSWTSCAKDCNGYRANCEHTGCGYVATVYASASSSSAVELRLPAVPSTAPGCAPCDGGLPTAVVQVHIEFPIPAYFKVKVDPPWRIIDDPDGSAFACMGPDAQADCAITRDRLYLVTDAPAVSPRNAMVTWAAPDSCP